MNNNNRNLDEDDNESNMDLGQDYNDDNNDPDIPLIIHPRDDDSASHDPNPRPQAHHRVQGALSYVEQGLNTDPFFSSLTRNSLCSLLSDDAALLDLDLSYIDGQILRLIVPGNV